MRVYDSLTSTNKTGNNETNGNEDLKISTPEKLGTFSSDRNISINQFDECSMSTPSRDKIETDQNDFTAYVCNKESTVRSATVSSLRCDMDKTQALATTVWNPKIDWSRSTVDLSSDEESVPNSISSTELSYMDGFEEETFIPATPQNLLVDDIWHDDVMDANVRHPGLHVPPFRRRASTTDGLFNNSDNTLNWQQYNPRYRGVSDSAIGDHRALHYDHDVSSEIPQNNQHVIPSPNRFRSRSEVPSCQVKFSSSSSSSAFTNVLKKLHVRQQRIPLASKGFMLLFVIAAYTTLCIPYLDISADLQKIIDKHGDNTDDISSMGSSGSVTALVVKDSSNHILGRHFEVQSSPPQPYQQHELTDHQEIASQTGHAVSNVYYARKHGNLKKFLRREEVVNFLQQKAIVQHQSTLIGRWHVHVVILAVVVVWAFLLDYVRIRNNRDTGVFASRLHQSPEIV
jgi:hypothetical protein